LPKNHDLKFDPAEKIYNLIKKKIEPRYADKFEYYKVSEEDLIKHKDALCFGI